MLFLIVYIFTLNTDCTFLGAGSVDSQELLINSDSTYTYKIFKNKSWYKSKLKVKESGKWRIRDSKLLLVCEKSKTAFVINYFDGKVLLIPPSDQLLFESTIDEIENLKGEDRLLKLEKLTQKYLSVSASSCLHWSKNAFGSSHE